jgi:phage/plasmid-like protein (TIGR03299 family)
MSPEQMLVAAGLDWTVSKRPAYFAAEKFVPNLYAPELNTNMVLVEDNFFVVRDTDNKVLSHAGTGYNPFQNRDVMSFFKKFTEAGDMFMETAGSLKEGQEIWGLAKLKDGFQLAGGDEVKGYLLLNNSHKVGKAMTVMFTPIRVVCNNTLTLALNDSGANKFRILHLQMFDQEIMQAAEEALGLSNTRMAQFKEQSEFLASKRAKTLDVDNFIAEMFQKDTLLERGKAVNQNELPPLRDEFKRTALAVAEAYEVSPGSTLASAKGTWWGALNAVTYVVDHPRRASNEGGSLYSAWFGNGANVKRKAMEKALEYAQAA